MNRQEGINHIVAELRDYLWNWWETRDWVTDEHMELEWKLDREALLAVGITEEEILEAHLADLE